MGRAGRDVGKGSCWKVCEDLRPQPWHCHREWLHYASGLLVPGHQLCQPRQRHPGPRKAVTSPKPQACGALYEDERT